MANFLDLDNFLITKQNVQGLRKELEIQHLF